MGNETSTEASGEESFHVQGKSSPPSQLSNRDGSNASPAVDSVGRGTMNCDGAPETPPLSISTSQDDYSSFATPNATPSTSVRPSPTVSARASPVTGGFQSRKSSSEPLQQLDAMDSYFHSSSSENKDAELSNPPAIIRSSATIVTDIGNDSNDTIDKPSQSALHESVMIVPDETEDHAWMDPVLAAAAAGAASRKSQEALEQSRRQPQLFGFRIDDEWRDSLQKLASTTKSTATSFAHMAAPMIDQAADTVTKSAWGESFQKAMGNGKRGAEMTDSHEHLPRGANNENERLSDSTTDKSPKGSFQHGASSTQKSAANGLTSPITPASNQDESVSWKHGSVSVEDELMDDRLKRSLQRFASTSQAAAMTFMHVAQPVLVETTDVVKKSMLDADVSNETTKKPKRRSEDNDHEKLSSENVAEIADTGGAHTEACRKELPTTTVDNEWMKSFDRLAATTKSATISLSHLAAPILEEASDAIKTAIPDVGSRGEMGKYGGVGYRPVIAESLDGDKSKVELKKSLERLASSTKATAATMVTAVTPILKDNAITVIVSMREAPEGHQELAEANMTVAAAKDGEQNTSLDTSQDETVLTSPGWHNKKTPLRAHRAPSRDMAISSTPYVVQYIGDSGSNSPGSLAASGSYDNTGKSLASQTTLSSPEKLHLCHRADSGSVTSLSAASSRSFVSSRRRGTRETRNKNSLSSPGRFVEMVTKRLAPDSSGYPPPHSKGRKSSQRTIGTASRTGSITPSRAFDRSIQSVFQERRQPETVGQLSPPDSPQQSGSINAMISTPPRLQPPQEVMLWDMLPENESLIAGEGSFLIEPRPRILLEDAPDHGQDELRTDSIYSSEDENSLPMSTGFIGKRQSTYDSNDTASDPGRTPMKKHRKSRRASQLRTRAGRTSLLHSTLSPSSSAIFGESLNLDTRSTFEETSPGSQEVVQQSCFRSPEIDGDSVTKISQVSDIQDKMLDEALMSFSSLPDVDFLDRVKIGDVPELLQSLASSRWRQLTANWEHDEMMKAITMRPSSVHLFNELNQQDERPNDWSESWTTTVYDSKRDVRYCLHDEFQQNRMTSPLMSNLSGCSPLLFDGQFQYLSPYLLRIGALREDDDSPSDSAHIQQVVLRHSIDAPTTPSVKDLRASATSKSAPFTVFMKQIATFAINDFAPDNPASAVRYSVDIKTADAITEKAKRKYSGDILQVKDVLRGQITFPNESSLVCAITSLTGLCGREEAPFKVVRVKNLFLSRPTHIALHDHLPTGYRHILVTLQFSDGFLAELQLQLSQMFDVLGQDGYKLHGELTRLDAFFKQVEIPDFDQCQGDSNLKDILKRMFDPPTKQPITGKGATKHHADCRSANGKLAVESTSESVSTSSCARSALPFLAGGDIAAAAAQSARSGDKASGKERFPDEKTVDDARYSGPHPFLDGGGIAGAAAAAAAAVLAQNKKTLKESSQSEDTATGNEADSSAPSGPPPSLTGEGIAAATAALARNKKISEVTDKSEDATPGSEPGSIAPSGLPPFLGGGGIAAAAAGAALARNKKTSEETSNSEDAATGGDPGSDAHSGPPPYLTGGGIAAAAAAAALVRNKMISEETDKSEDVTTGSEPDSIAPSGSPPFLAGGGIAAAAAAAALARSEKTSEETGKPEDAATGGEPDSNAHSGPPSSLAGGGIAAAAAAAALARNKKSSGETDKSEDVTIGSEPDSIAPSGLPPFVNGGSIAATAAAAALARMKKAAEVSSEDAASPREFNEAASKPNESDGTGSMDGSNPKNSLDAVGVASNIGVIFSDKEMMKALIAEALNDASKHSRRISTLYCASSLCCLVASMMNTSPGLEIMTTDNSMKEYPVLAENNTKEESSVQSFDVATRTNGESTCTGNFSRQQEDGKETLHMTASGDQDEHGKEPQERSHPGDSEVVVDAVTEQEEKKEACDDASSPKNSPSMFSRLFGRKSMKGEKEETTDVGSGFDNATGAGGASCRTEDQPSENAREEPTSGKSTESGEDASHASSDKQNDSPNASSSITVSNVTGVEVAKDEAQSIAGTPSFDPSRLVDVSGEALLRGLTIANQASSRGMIGWLEYGSSSFLDRTAGRPLDILQKLAYQHALRREWEASIDILRTLVLRCEQHLPLYHPVTLASMLDLAVTCSSASEHPMASHIVVEVSERLAFYLAEQETVYMEFHYSLRSGNGGDDVRFEPLTGADHVVMLRSFASLFEELVHRDYLQLFGDENEILLINHCLAGDTYAVLANCLALSEAGAGKNAFAPEMCESSKKYWSTAFRHYRRAFVGWTRSGYKLSHPSVSAAACSMARCLRELKESDKATTILTSVVGATTCESIGGDMPRRREREHFIEDYPPSTSSFLLPHHAPSSVGQLSDTFGDEATALRLWHMAAYAVEANPDERGRIRALSLLHASSEALQRALEENDGPSNTRRMEMFQCVEEEARELFAPLDTMQDEEDPLIDPFHIGAMAYNPTVETRRSANTKEPYPERKRLHHTGTKASFLPSAFA